MAKALPQKKNPKISSPNSAKFWQARYFNELLVFTISIFLFAYAISCNYNMDDELVTINHRLTSKGISAIPEIFTSPYYRDESGYAYEYRPVVLASFAIEHEIFGDNAHISHLINVILYALCCILLLNVLSKIFKNYSPILALAITLLFIVHPAHTEVVCSIKNRDEILGLIFALLALLVLLKGIETSRKWWYAFTPLLFTLALMSKVTIICFVLLIPLALIFFTEASLALVLVITLLLLIPSFFILNLDSGWEKILLFIGIMMVNAGFYAIVNFETVMRNLKRLANHVSNILFSDVKIPDKNIESKVSFSRDSILNSISAAKDLFAIGPFLLAFTLGGLYLLCIASQLSLIGIIPITLLLILKWKGTERISLWAEITIGIILVASTYAIYSMGDTSKDWDLMIIYGRPIGLYLAYQIRYGQRKLVAPHLFLFALFSVMYMYLAREFDTILYLLIYFLDHSIVRYAIIVLCVYQEIALVPFKAPGHLVNFISLGIEIAVVLCIQFKKAVGALPWALIILSLTWFHENRFSYDKSIHIQSTVLSMENASNKINPEIISTLTYRPLSYIEECVDRSSPITARLGTSFEILFHYLGKVALPYPSSFYYGSKFIYPQKITEPIPSLSLVIYLFLSVAAFFLIRRQRLISFGLFIYLISMAVFSNYLQAVPGMIADRFLLIPSLGWSIVLVVIFKSIFKVNLADKSVSLSSVPRYGRYSFCIVLLLYGFMSFSRTMDWYDDLTLMRHDIKVVPQSIQAHNLLGIHLVKKSFTLTDAGEQRNLRLEALEHLKTANSLYPGYFNFTYDIGRTYNLLGIPDSAIVYFKEALIINPNFYDVSLNIANIYFGKNDMKSSIPYFVNLVNIHRADFSVYDKLSYAYFKTNQIGLSIETNEDAIKQFPNQVDPYINIATCYITNNSRDSAVIWLNRALAVSPNNPNVLNYLKKISK